MHVPSHYHIQCLSLLQQLPFLEDWFKIFSLVHNNMPLVKPDNENMYWRQRKVEKVTNLTWQRVLQFSFFFSCHSLHLVVIARVRRSSKKFPFSWKAVPSASHEVLKGDDKTVGTHQLSALQHRVAKSQAYCFPLCRSSAPWQTTAEDCPKWWHNCCVDTASAWNRNPADFAVSGVGEAFCFAISLSAHCRNLSLVLQATLPLS